MLIWAKTENDKATTIVKIEKILDIDFGCKLQQFKKIS
jgi:hypothetical protein